MSKNDCVTIEGEVIDALPNSLFKVKLLNEHTIIAHLAGKIRKNSIRVLQGDRVKCELSPYDLTKGRIVFRYR